MPIETSQNDQVERLQASNETERSIGHITLAPGERLLTNLQAEHRLIQQLLGGGLHSYATEDLRAILRALKGGIPFPVIQVAGFPTRLFRGFNCEDVESVPADVRAYSYCPKEIAVECGRCHPPKSSMFYGALDLSTMLSEVCAGSTRYVRYGVARWKEGARQNDFVTVGQLDQMRRFRTTAFGPSQLDSIVQNVLDQTPAEQRARCLLIDAFFGDLFSRDARRVRDYRSTYFLSEMMLTLATGERRDGIFYPSVAHRGGLNLAIVPESFDECFEWERFEVLEIIEPFAYNLFLQRTVAKSKSISGGKIEWEILG